MHDGDEERRVDLVDTPAAAEELEPVAHERVRVVAPDRVDVHLEEEPQERVYDLALANLVTAAAAVGWLVVASGFSTAGAALLVVTTAALVVLALAELKSWTPRMELVPKRAACSWPGSAAAPPGCVWLASVTSAPAAFGAAATAERGFRIGGGTPFFVLLVLACAGRVRVVAPARRRLPARNRPIGEEPGPVEAVPAVGLQ